MTGLSQIGGLGQPPIPHGYANADGGDETNNIRKEAWKHCRMRLSNEEEYGGCECDILTLRNTSATTYKGIDTRQ